MNDLRLEAMDAPLVRHYHDRAELCLEKLESAWTPVSRWLWDRKLKAANSMWREVLEQEINQLRAERGMPPSTQTSLQLRPRLKLDTAASGMILE
ncbi:MAG: hypothetical protein ABJK20_15595 [Halieaceae bacterium]